MADLIQIRRDTAANWTSSNPTLAQGELGLETDTSQLKAGDGTTAWTSLGYYDLGGLTDPTYTGTPIEDIYAMSGTSVALEPSNGSIQTHTLSGATTYTDAFSAGQAITLMIDDGTAATITWPTMTWVNNAAVAPTLATTGYTVITVWKVDDGSASNHTITAVGNVTQGSFGPFARDAGNWSVDYTATDSPYTKVLSDGTNLGAGTGAYTVEAWINWSEWAGTNQRIWLMGRSGADFIVLGKHSDENRLFTKGDTIDYDFTPNLGQWYHIAVVRASTGTDGLSLYIDGTRVAQGQDTSTVDAEDFYVSGLDWATGYNLRGQASNFRYTKSAVYSGASFTVPDGPLTAIANTEILMCQDNRFVDNSIRARAISIGGSPSVSAFGPFLTSEVYDPAVNGASVYINDAGALSLGTSTDFNFGTADFTVEAFIKYEGGAGSGDDSYVISFGGGAGNAGHFGINIYQGSWRVGAFNDSLAGGTVPTDKAWHHIAMVYQSNVFKFYVDGVLISSAANSGPFNTTTAVTISSYFGDTSYGNFVGYISDVRVVKGTAVYTSAFTPPTAPLTAITNTKLLLNMADGQAIDSAAQNNLTLADDVKLSTAKAKFGDTSMLFDGSGKAYIESSNVVNFGSGNFTVEFFMNITTGGAEEVVFDARNPSQGAYFDLELDTSNRLNYYVLSGIRITSSALSTNTWYHVAVCRSGTSTKMFIDGTQAGSTYSDSTVYLSTNRVVLGGYSNSATYDFDGYLDEIRVSKTARYTSNFTAPTEPFADKGE